MSSIISRLSYMFRILFWSIVKHIRILFLCIALNLLLMHVVVFNIRSAMVSKKYLEIVKKQAEIATGGLLLPRAALLLLPHARRWDALDDAAPLLLPCVRRRLHPMTPLWRCGRCLLLLRHASRRLHPMTPPLPPLATMMNALTSKWWAHMNYL
jgi:hypothetical protein